MVLAHQLQSIACNMPRSKQAPNAGSSDCSRAWQEQTWLMLTQKTKLSPNQSQWRTVYDWREAWKKWVLKAWKDHDKNDSIMTIKVQIGECHRTMNALMNWLADIFKIRIRTISTAKHSRRRLSPRDNGLVVVKGQPTFACSQHQFCFTCVHDVLITVEALTEFSEQKCLQALVAK